MRATVYNCDGCGIAKGDSNHWYKVGILPGVRFIVLPWEENYGADEDFAEQQLHVCGASCLLERGLGKVLRELAEAGFDAEWDVLSSCSMGAPHPRERVFIVAYPTTEWWGQRGRIEQQKNGHPQRDLHFWANEPEPPRVVDGLPNRMVRLERLGNAVVPQVAEWIGRRILEAICL